MVILYLVFGIEQGISSDSAHQCDQIHHMAERQMVPDKYKKSVGFALIYLAQYVVLPLFLYI